MTERSKRNENTYTNMAFSEKLSKSTWKNILRTSIEVLGETIIPGEFGFTVCRGTLSCSDGKTKEACLVKILQGKVDLSIQSFLNCKEIYRTCPSKYAVYTVV